MEQLLTAVEEFFRTQQVVSVVRAILIIIGGLVVARIISRLLVRAVQSTLDTHRLMLVRRGSYYAILSVFLIAALMELGFDLGILLGTAGILTVALAFASQTSMSNLISGLFLIAENPFEVGDLIQVGSTVGEVLQIDLLSIKLRKFDNTFVRLPNEMLIKTEFMTLTKFPIRRLDLQIGVAYHENMAKVKETLMTVAEKNPLSLAEPEPVFVFQGFGDSALEIQFSVWVLRENYLLVNNSIQEEIKQAFDAAGIEIPFPQRALHAGGSDTPFPVQLVDPEAQAATT